MILQKIKTLLSNQAPLILDALLEGANDIEINQLKQISEVENLPKGLIDLYRSSKGLNSNKIANFAYGLSFLSLDEVIVQMQDECGNIIELEHADNGIKPKFSLSNKHIPIGHDSGNCFIYVDLDPEKEGCYGQVIFIDYDYRVAIKLADSVEEYIHNFTEDLKNHKYTLNTEALQDGFNWLQPDNDIDLINWFNSTQWEHIKT